MSKKALCAVYDIQADLISDNELREDLMVATLGRFKVNDGHGAIYKIISKSGVNTTTIPGFDIGPESPFYAKLITDTNISEVLNEIRNLTNEALEEIGNIETDLGKNLDAMDEKLQKVFDHSAEILYEYDLSGDGLIKTFLAGDLRRYMMIKIQEPFEASYTIKITEKNRWMIPREFILTDVRERLINDKIGSVKYDDVEKLLTYNFHVKNYCKYHLIEY